jgi:NTE family protein
METRKKVGLALGSGSARGFSHIGILRVFEEAQIPIDCIAGTSIGAIVGAFYAAGVLGRYEEFLHQLDWKETLNFMLDPLLPVSGLLSGKKLERLFTSLLEERNIEDFALPFAAVAADVVTGEEIVLHRGNAVKAIRASMSIPGIFTPVYLEERFLVDGGIVSPVPVQAARQLGADVVIAVNLAAEMTKRTHISTVKATAEQLQAFEDAHAENTTTVERLIRQEEKMTGIELPGFLKDTVIKGRNFVGEQAQALEQWFDEKVERGRSVVEKRTSLFSEWFKKDEKSAELPNIFGVIFNSINIMQYEIAKSSLRQDPPEVLLEPDLAKVRLLDFDQVEECIREGERVARAALPQIEHLLNS